MSHDYYQIAEEVLNTEASALLNLANNLPENFNKAINLLLKTKGHVIVTGIGKSGHIGRKITSSLASTGTTSFFLHPSEAIHGDLGMIDKNDLVLALTNSGETAEIVRILPYISKNNIPLISITSKPKSTIAQKSDVHLSIGDFEEACPLNLAPTTSSLLTLALGDALMIALMEGRGFDEHAYAQLHPGGNLGKKLIGTVSDIMVSDDLPFISLHAEMSQITYIINKGRLGLGIVGEKNNILGIITDGDLRRAMEKSKHAFFDLKAEDFMTKSPRFISKNTKLVDAKNTMHFHKITTLLVGNQNNLEGILHLHDINL